MTAIQRAAAIIDSMPVGGLFAGQRWRTAPRAFPLGADLAADLNSLGRVLLQFYRAVNLLYRRSAEGKMPAWIASLLDQGKPDQLLAWQRHPAFRNELPRVIRPDVLLCEDGFVISELDSVPGGIGLTHWLNATYSTFPDGSQSEVLGGPRGMLDGFSSIFGEAGSRHIVVSEESASYRPEMEWMAALMGNTHVRPADFLGFGDGDSVYRFFELFDLGNVPSAEPLFERACRREIRVTPPPKPMFEEKLLSALLWNRNLQSYWRQELGDAFFRRLLKVTPRSWVVDPSPLPPHAAYPGLEITDWQQLKSLSQRERELILKVSGFSPQAWGARGVHLGSDLSTADWSAAVDEALQRWPQSPYVLQRFHRPRLVSTSYIDLDQGREVAMDGRVRLCPYYFVQGDGDKARAVLGGVLATICPADKKIIHGMTDSILAPCSVA